MVITTVTAAATAVAPFSVSAVRVAFRDAQVGDEDVDIKNYVLAYQELCK